MIICLWDWADTRDTSWVWKETRLILETLFRPINKFINVNLYQLLFECVSLKVSFVIMNFSFCWHIIERQGIELPALNVMIMMEAIKSDDMKSWDRFYKAIWCAFRAQIGEKISPIL